MVLSMPLWRCRRSVSYTHLEVVETLQDALACADRIGYPVIVRPAFTMGGTGGGICETREKLIEIGTRCV